MKECTFSPRFFSDRQRSVNMSKLSIRSNDTYISMKDRAMHSGYHQVRQKKKFIPVTEEYLYKRSKGKVTYSNYYKRKKKAHFDPNSIYLRILNQKNIGRKKRKFLNKNNRSRLSNISGASITNSKKIPKKRRYFK